MKNRIDISCAGYDMILEYDYSQAVYGHNYGLPYVLHMRKLPQGPRYTQALTINPDMWAQESLRSFLIQDFIEHYEQALQRRLRSRFGMEEE